MKKVSLKLTAEEAYIISLVVSSAQDCMQYDEDIQEYTDGGRFILSLNEEEYKTLMKLSIMSKLA